MPQSHIHIIFSSGGGNTVMVVEKIKEVLHAGSITTSETRAVIAGGDDFVVGKIVILACPTYDHGVCHAPYEKLLGKMKGIDLSGQQFAIVGLGDNKYDEDYNVESAAILEEFVTAHGGTFVCESLRINKSPIDKLDTVIQDRAEGLCG